MQSIAVSFALEINNAKKINNSCFMSDKMQQKQDYRKSVLTK